MRYRDLPASHFTPRAYQRLEIPKGANFHDLSISPDGKLYWSYSEQGKGASVFDQHGQRINFRLPDGLTFRFPNVQRYLDGRWLVAESRTLKDANAFVFESDGTLIRSFYSGDGIQTLLLDHHDKAWIGYFDEGIFGGGSAPSQYGPSGLVRLDEFGKIEFSYNDKFPTKFISDINAMTIDDEDSLWFCPYTDFFLASVRGNSVNFVLPLAPTAGADSLSIGKSICAFFGGLKQKSMIALMDRKSLSLRLIQLHNSRGDTLSPVRVATRGTCAIAVADNQLYRLDQEILLDALGPWTDDNSATLESAVEYLSEETSYAGIYQIYPNGPRFIPGAPRPPQNPPRHDEDTVR